MPFVQAKCPNCGETITVNNLNDADICPLCNTPFVVDKAINSYTTTSIKNTEEDKEEDKQATKKAILFLIALAVCIVGIVIFIYGATTGTVTGYKGANGLYYTNPGTKSTHDWMCVPGLIIAVIGGISVYVISKKNSSS